jgi:hypothetical protein
MSFKHDYDSETWYNVSKVRKMYLIEDPEDVGQAFVNLIWEDHTEETIFEGTAGEAIDFMNNLME